MHFLVGVQIVGKSLNFEKFDFDSYYIYTSSGQQICNFDTENLLLLQMVSKYLVWTGIFGIQIKFSTSC